MEVSHKDLKVLLKRSIGTQVPLYIWGAPGIGKSQMVKQVCKNIAEQKGKEFSTNIEDINDENKFVLIDLRVSQFDPSDLRGLPKISEEGTKWIPNSWMPKSGEGVIFFDELNLAPPSIQAASYQLILDRRLGEYELPKGFSILAAGNRLEDKANVFELPAPLANRFSHTTLISPGHEAWADWASKNNINPDIIGFMYLNPSLLFKFDPKSKEKAFPTPRSWEMTSKMINGIKDLDDIYIMASTTVGEAAATQLMGFMKLKNKIDIHDILNNPTVAKIPKANDLLYALITGITEIYKDGGHDLKTFNKIIKVMEPMDKASGTKEFPILMLKMIKNSNNDKFKENFQKAFSGHKFEKIIESYKDFLIDE